MERISLGALKMGFPDFLELKEPWMERLGISEPDRRHYVHLNQVELQFLITMFRLVEEYATMGILQEDAQMEALVRRTAEEIDSRWLNIGKGRAVDFKRIVTIWKAYQAYHEWAVKCLGAEGKMLDVIVPYQVVDRVSNYFGLLRFKVEVVSGSVRKLGDISWDLCRVTLYDLAMEDDFSKENFLKDPFRYLPKKLSLRQGGQFNCGNKLPLARQVFRGINSEKIPKRGPFGENYKFSSALEVILDTENKLSFSYPYVTRDSMQEYLEDMARYFSEIRLPGTAQLSFEVADDFTGIRVLSNQSETNQPVQVRVLDKDVN